MAAAIEYGLIAAGISAAIVGTAALSKALQPADPVKARYEMIDRKCAEPTLDGSRREIVYLGERNNMGGYVLCPRKD